MVKTEDFECSAILCNLINFRRGLCFFVCYFFSYPLIACSTSSFIVDWLISSLPSNLENNNIQPVMVIQITF